MRAGAWRRRHDGGCGEARLAARRLARAILDRSLSRCGLRGRCSRPRRHRRGGPNGAGGVDGAVPARPACHLPTLCEGRGLQHARRCRTPGDTVARDGARRRARRRSVVQRRGVVRRRGGRLCEQRALQVWRRIRQIAGRRSSGPRTIERRCIRRRDGHGPRGAAREVVQHGRIGLAIGEPAHEVLYPQLLACL